MSYVMNQMIAKSTPASYDPHKTLSERFSVFVVQCRCCGFEPEDGVVPPRTCPKCHSQSWERFARPGSILANAGRYPG
jgi:predicted Zn-ribbon and HTH transcriptional regulator